MVEALFPVRKNPCGVARKGMFQTLANHGVKAQQVVGRDTLTVGRIGDDDGFLRRLLELLERLQLQYHVLAYAGSLYIVCGNFVCLRAVVVTVYLMRKFTFLAVVIVYRVEQLLVKIHPLLESELLAEYARSDVACNQRRFDGNGSRTTHRVYQVAFATPAGHQYHAGGQHLIQRGLYCFLAITAAVQRFAAGVERQRTFGLGNVYVQQHVRFVDTHAGTFAGLLAEIVHDGILHLVGNELGMTELFTEYNRVHGKGLVRIQIVFPSDGFNLFVNLVGILGCEVFDGFQYPDGCTQAEVCLVHHFLITTERYHAAAYFYFVGAQCSQLLCQYLFQSLEGFGNHFKRLFAHLCIYFM